MEGERRGASGSRGEPARDERETIAAVATPAGAGGVGIVRVSGPRAARVVADVMGRRVDRLEDRVLTYGVARERAGERIDEVLGVVMRGPRSFTGEDVGELHGHGGVVNMRRLLEAVLDAGARPAEPGEFTRRAFENGRLDLTRAEALAAVIEASSERAWRIAQAQLEGDLGARIRGLRDRVVGLLAELEVSIDFPEEDAAPEASKELSARAEAVRHELARLEGSFRAGKAIREGIEVALVGPVNGGKSSLLNALVGKERAIVAKEPGTTRDVVEVRTEWGGVPIVLLDTAGERSEGGAVEEEGGESVRCEGGAVERKGIEIGRRRAAEADLEIVVVPADAAEKSVAERPSGRTLKVLTKVDRLTERPGREIVATSAQTGEGLEALREAVLERVTGAEREADDGVVVTSERQRRGIGEAAAALGRAQGRLAEQAPAEIVALEIEEASARLAEVLGEEVADEMLDDLFSRFCIGK